VQWSTVAGRIKRYDHGLDSLPSHGDVILPRSIDTEILDPLLDLALQHIALALGRPDQVVEGTIDGIGGASEARATLVLPYALIPPAASSGAA
jgi:hypothetical protein